ncbi:hypothetical protein CDD81_2577 [Ophiocordyceps australis]|uniref:Ketoreductase (KR) domain-containing protein n=1 Tax=Ophiocordyceps australis TaxID=1399860 RepID=A0A2C5XWK8_9HYPO|nr:hypothetical protein CDD81_2577 [Ophiocordyceps australis]
MVVPLPFLSGFIYRQLLLTPPQPTTRFDGQTIIITGATSGLGFEAARLFARLGAAHIILGARNVTQGEAAARAVAQAASSKEALRVDVWELDLEKYASVREFAARVDGLERVDVVCQNAGMATGRFCLAEKDESTVTVNVVCAVLLTLLVLPKLKESAARFGIHPVVTFSCSEIHHFYEFTQRNEPQILATLSDKSKASMLDRYFVSKLLQLLCVRELASRAGPAYPVAINCFNPGFVQTRLGREFGWNLYLWGVVFARSARVGSRTLVAAAGAGAESHGKYMSEGEVAEPSEWVRSEEGKRVQRRVWEEVVERVEGIVPGVSGNI